MKKARLLLHKGTFFPVTIVIALIDVVVISVVVVIFVVVVVIVVVVIVIIAVVGRPRAEQRYSLWQESIRLIFAMAMSQQFA